MEAPVYINGLMFRCIEITARNDVPSSLRVSFSSKLGWFAANGIGLDHVKKIDGMFGVHNQDLYLIDENDHDLAWALEFLDRNSLLLRQACAKMGANIPGNDASNISNSKLIEALDQLIVKPSSGLSRLQLWYRFLTDPRNDMPFASHSKAIQDIDKLVKQHHLLAVDDHAWIAAGGNAVCIITGLACHDVVVFDRQNLQLVTADFRGRTSSHKSSTARSKANAFMADFKLNVFHNIHHLREYLESSNTPKETGGLGLKTMVNVVLPEQYTMPFTSLPRLGTLREWQQKLPGFKGLDDTNNIRAIKGEASPAELARKCVDGDKGKVAAISIREHESPLFPNPDRLAMAVNAYNLGHIVHTSFPAQPFRLGADVPGTTLIHPLNPFLGHTQEC